MVRLLDVLRRSRSFKESAKAIFLHLRPQIARLYIRRPSKVECNNEVHGAARVDNTLSFSKILDQINVRNGFSRSIVVAWF